MDLADIFLTSRFYCTYKSEPLLANIFSLQKFADLLANINGNRINIIQYTALWWGTEIMTSVTDCIGTTTNVDLSQLSTSSRK
jgi:hypothetical protein